MILNERLPLHHDFTIPLVDQVKQWIQFAAGIIPHPVDQTLTTWWIGINDTGDTVTNSTVRAFSKNKPSIRLIFFLAFLQQITDFNAFWEVEMNSYFNAVVRDLPGSYTVSHV